MHGPINISLTLEVNVFPPVPREFSAISYSMYHISAHLFCLKKEPTTYYVLTSVNSSHSSVKHKFPTFSVLPTAVCVFFF